MSNFLESITYFQDGNTGIGLNYRNALLDSQPNTCDLVCLRTEHMALERLPRNLVEGNN